MRRSVEGGLVLHRMTQGCFLGALLLVPGCMTRGLGISDDSALPRESGTAPQPVALKNFLKDKDIRSTSGLFVTYSYRTKTYMLVQHKQLGKPFMLTSQVSQGTGRLGGGDVLGALTGSRVQSMVVSLVRHGNRLYLIEQPHAYLDQAEQWTAVHRTFSPTVVTSIPILAEGSASSTTSAKPSAQDVLVGLDELLLEDLVAAMPVGRERQKATRKQSYVESHSGTAQSTSLRVRLGYSSATVTELGHSVNSVGVTYSFVQLPSSPMQRRKADDRMGTFTTPFRDFQSPESRMQSHAVVRWRLEADHREGTLLVPKKPIVFYLDSATPKGLQPYILDGVRQWNRAFEAAGWKDAVRAAVLPAKLALDDPRIAVIHWDVGEHSLNGRGQPLVDPRSGEILSATLILSMNPLRHHLRLRKTVLRPHQQQETIDAALSDDQEELGAVLGTQGDVLRAALLGKRALTPSEPLPDALLGQRMRLLAMHEVGHALGLRHNFRASTHTPSEQLGNKEWYKKSPLLASVMDYPALNLPATAAEGNATTDFPYYQASIGPSDVMSIAYAYSPDPMYAVQLASQAAKWGYVFGSDDEADSDSDPSVQRWDLGGEPLTWAKDRAKALRDLWQQVEKGSLLPGDRPADVTQVAASLLYDFERAVGAVPAYIGGRYGSRDHLGDPGGKPASRAVEKSKQSAALSFLLSEVLSESSLPMTPALAERLGEDYLTPRHSSPRKQTDLPLWRQVLDLRISILRELLEPARLRRMVDGEQAFGRDAVLTVGELLSQLTQSLFAEIISGNPGAISPLRRELQLRYVERLTHQVLHVAPESRHARAQARYQLQQIESKLEELRPKRSALDVDTRAHVIELGDSISATLNGARVIHTPTETRRVSESEEPVD